MIEHKQIRVMFYRGLLQGIVLTEKAGEYVIAEELSKFLHESIGMLMYSYLFHGLEKPIERALK